MPSFLHIALTLFIALIMPMSRYSDTPKVRKPAVAGSFYPASAREIKSMLTPWLHSSAGDAAPQAIIVPHAGYVFSGEVAGSAFSRIPRGHTYKRIFLLGPSHRVGFTGASVDTGYDYAETPLGKVPIDVSLGEELVRQGLTFRYDAHDREHCLEVQLPFLQLMYQDVPPIVPIIIGTERPAVLEEIARILKPYFTLENLFIISSDFSSLVRTSPTIRPMTTRRHRTCTWRMPSSTGAWKCSGRRSRPSGRWTLWGRTPPRAAPAPSRSCCP